MADDQLVVKSDHNWLQTMIVYAGSIVLYCSIIIFYKGKGKVDFESIVLDLILIIVAIMVILWFWWEVIIPGHSEPPVRTLRAIYSGNSEPPYWALLHIFPLYCKDTPLV